MEKEHQPDSMATITMKPEYPPSEYSASEPPPAYRHHGSTSVQIARIVALTVVASSVILGSFILASSWVSARSSCHQLEQLDAMLDKELALEGRAYGNDGLMADEPLPVGNAHALHAAAPLPNLEAPVSSVASAGSNKVPVADSQHKDDALNQAESKIDEDKLQKIDGTPTKTALSSDSDESSESDSSAEEEDELDGVRPMFKLPIQFDLDEIAGAFLANSQKGRMNCVVERRHEEPMERRFPFNILGAFAPRAASGGAERVAIICHGGDEQRPMNFPEPQSQVFAFPLSGPVRLPLRPQPERPMERPLGAASEPRMPPFAPQHRPAPFPLPMPWDSSEEQMGAPREMRIHVQRVIAIPSQHNVPPPAPQDGNMGPFQPPPLPPQQDQNERQAVMHQFVPQPAPIQELEQPEMQKISNQGQMSLPWGLTPEDLHTIHRSAEEAAAMHHRSQQMDRDNDMQEVPEAFLMAPGKIPNEVKTIVNTLAAAEAQAQAEEEAEEQRRQQAAAQAQQLEEAQSPRAARTMMLPQDGPSMNDERPHYVQPRSVRSVRSADPMKRMKRYASCTCA